MQIGALYNMADKMMRMAGRGDDGLAKAISINDSGSLLVSAKSKVLVDEEIVTTSGGWHVFGKTCGRAHQEILNVSEFKNLIITVESYDATPGNYEVLFFSEADRLMTGASYNSDKSITHSMGEMYAQAHVSGNKKILTNVEYPILDMPKIGMVVAFRSVPVGSRIKVRILGGV